MSGHRKWSEIRKGSAQEHGEPLKTLSDLRRENGLNQQELADELGVSQVSISKIEHQDDPQVSTLMRYLGALGANLELRAVFPDRSATLYFLTDGEVITADPATDPELSGKAMQVGPVSANK